MTELKTVFKVDDVEYAVLRPTSKAVAEGRTTYNKAFQEALNADAILRGRLDMILRKQNLWDDDKQRQAERINAEIAESERLLGRRYRLEGATKVALKLSEAKAIAIRLRQLRNDLRSLLSDRLALDRVTAEAQAENARFNLLLAACFVRDDGKPVFKDVNDYLEHASEPHAYAAAGHLAAMLLSDSDPDWESRLPENKLLLKYGFVDDKLRLIDRQGRLVDAEGRLIREDGRFVNENGDLVNRDGERVDENGEAIYDDAVEFVDDLVNA